MSKDINSVIEREAAKIHRKFLELIDLARSGGGLQVWPEAVGLLVLPSLFNEEDLSKWRQAVESRKGRQSALPGLASEFSSLVEKEHNDLCGVFTRALLGGLNRLSSELMDDWIHQVFMKLWLQPADRMAVDRWFDFRLSDFLEKLDGTDHFTNRALASLIVRMADIGGHMSVLDPCCGNGSLLLTAFSESPAGSQIHIFGQETSPASWAISKLRFFMKQSLSGNIKLGDFLRRPAFDLGGGGPCFFNRVICHLPIGATVPEIPKLLSRNSPGKLAKRDSSRTSIDSAFTRQILSHLAPSGRAVVLLTQGFLFRSSDLPLRRHLVLSKRIKAVFSIPPKYFRTTAVEMAIVVLEANAEEILVADFSNLRQSIRGLLPQDVEKIYTASSSGDDTSAGTVRKVPISEIKAANFILLPKHYITVHTDENKSSGLLKELGQLDTDANRSAKQFDLLFRELQQRTLME